MANPHKGELAVKAGGKTYTLQYTHAALIDLEEVLDKGILAIVNEMQTWGKDPARVRMKWLRAMLWAGLRKHHPNISLEAAGELMTDFGGAGAIMGITGDAIARAFNTPEDKAEGPPQEPGPTSNGTGTSSGSTMSASDTAGRSSGTSPRVN